MRDLSCCAHARDGKVEIVDRSGPLAAVILDRAANRAGLRREPDRLRRHHWLMREAILEIGIHGNICCIGDRLGSAHLAVDAANPSASPISSGDEAPATQRSQAAPIVQAAAFA
jgi:hypothetical protein